MIANRNEYPIGKNFSPFITELTAVNLKLRLFDLRFLNLKLLTYLNVSFNQIESIPGAIEHLILKKLVLNNNKLICFPSITKMSLLAESLSCLILSHNEIKWLPDDFWNFVNLHTLDLSSEYCSLHFLCTQFISCISYYILIFLR